MVAENKKELLSESSLDTFIAYSFIDKLTKPYEETKAFQLGVIDKDGNVLIPRDKRTSEQKASFTTFDRLVFNLRKIITKYVPFGHTRLARYATALFLLKEEKRNSIESFVCVERLILKELNKQFDNELLNEELGEFLSSFNMQKPIERDKEYQLCKAIITTEDIVPPGHHVVFEDVNPVDTILGLDIYGGIHVETGNPIAITRKDINT